MKKQSKENQQIAKIIERDQIISYKKKPSTKPPPKQSDDEIQSANSLKSGVFSEDSQVRNSKKNTPLPQLYRDKKRIFHKNFAISQVKQVNNYLEKQVRQHDNLVLKQKNNHLTTENMKLKTKIMALQKQIARINKSADEQAQRPKQPGLMPKDNKLKGSEVLSLKMTIKNLRKQFDQQKKQNQKIKWSIKFTRINQLQCERDQILNETARLRQMLEQQQSKRAFHKAKQQGLTAIQQKLQSLSEKNSSLTKQNAQLKKKLKAFEEGNVKIKQFSDNQKNLSKMLFNAKRLIKEKQKQIENLKVQATSTQTKIQSVASINLKSSKEVSTIEDGKDKSKQKRIMSKSAQKYRKRVSDETHIEGECKNCHSYKQKISELQRKIQDLNLKLKVEKEANSKFRNMGEFSREEIQAPKNQEIDSLSRFLVFRFKAHHLNFEQAQKYLINSQVTEDTKKQSISVLQMSESLVAEPFSILSGRYLQVCLMKLFYKNQCEKNSKTPIKIKIDQNKKLTKGEILVNFAKFVKPFQVMPQEKQEQMFIQIAELVTNYHQHILTALNRKRNGQGTISQVQLSNFFNQIELQKQFTDFIICQIILQSLDLDHLNYYTMFEIFYMPTQGQATAQSQPNQPNKKKFQVDHSQVVKEQDEQYQESKSHIDTRKKTQSMRDQDQMDEQNEQNQQNDNSPSQHSEKQRTIHKGQQEALDIKEESRQKRNNSMKNVEAKINRQLQKQKQKQKEKQKQKQKEKEKEKEEEDEEMEYEAQFEEQKMEHAPEQEKANEDKIQDEEELKPYMMEEVYDQYQEDN